jgi:hypothetical protein
MKPIYKQFIQRICSRASVGILLLFAVLGIVPSFAQSKPSFPGDPTAAKTDTRKVLGMLEDGLYRNTFFGFTFRVPTEGVVLNRAEIEVYRSAGSDTLKNISGELDRRLEQELESQVVLFNYASKPLGSRENAVLLIDVIKQPTGATANMVTAQTLTDLKLTGKFELVNTLKGINYGQKQFSGIQGMYCVNEQKLNQRMMVTMVRGYSLSIGITYTNDEELKKVEAILTGIEFTEP